MSFFSVDDLKCTRCGTCAGLCPVEIISFGEDGLPQVNQARAAACIKCGQCVIFCPTRADSLAFQNPDELVHVSELPLPETDQALNLLKTRRSVRRFKPEAVTEKDFMTIFDTVRMAPTASNSQRVRWIVSQYPGKTKQILGHAHNWVREVIFNEPTSRWGILGARILAKAQDGTDIILRGAPNVIIAVTPKEHGWSEDGVIALTYVELAAHAMGLGCCWGGIFTMAVRGYPPLREFLGIREDETICGAQMIGYPAVVPTRLFPPRKIPSISWLK